MTAPGQSTKFSDLFASYAIDGSTVAFAGYYNSGNGRGVYTGTVGSTILTRIADYSTTAPGQSTAFSSFSDDPVLSGGNIAFYATFNSGSGGGIFLYQNSTLLDVVSTGESLFGSTVTTVGSVFSLENNNLTYNYTLANGVRGIGTFTTVPEPATWLAGALLLAGSGWTLRRRAAGRNRPSA